MLSSCATTFSGQDIAYSHHTQSTIVQAAPIKQLQPTALVKRAHMAEEHVCPAHDTASAQTDVSMAACKLMLNEASFHEPVT